jgi:hypothetical protein
MTAIPSYKVQRLSERKTPQGIKRVWETVGRADRLVVAERIKILAMTDGGLIRIAQVLPPNRPAARAVRESIVIAASHDGVSW